MDDPTAIIRFLSSHTVSELVKTPFHLISVHEDSTIAEVVNTLRYHNILSVPIRGSQGDFVGMVDMLDLVTACVTKFATVSLLSFVSFPQMEEFTRKPVKDLMFISGRGQWKSIIESASLLELSRLLSERDLHRVSVLEESNSEKNYSKSEGKVIGIVSQWMLVEFLFKNRAYLPESILKEKIESMARLNEVENINYCEFMIRGFQKIWDREVSAIAVVDEQERLVGCLSASDLKNISIEPIGELIHSLYRPIKDFLLLRAYSREYERKEGDLRSLNEMQAIFVTVNHSFEQVMQLVLEHHIHRVFLIDNQRRPIGVISLRELIQRSLSMDAENQSASTVENKTTKTALEPVPKESQ